MCFSHTQHVLNVYDQFPAQKMNTFSAGSIKTRAMFKSRPNTVEFEITFLLKYIKIKTTNVRRFSGIEGYAPCKAFYLQHKYLNMYLNRDLNCHDQSV